MPTEPDNAEVAHGTFPPEFATPSSPGTKDDVPTAGVDQGLCFHCLWLPLVRDSEQEIHLMLLDPFRIVMDVLRDRAGL